jgi:methylation protein EvaC
MNCFLCKQGKLVEFLNLGRQPLANKYPKNQTDFQKEDFFPLTVLFCPACKNVQLGTTISRARMFEDYYYLSSVNPGLVRHFEALAKQFKKATFVVDIGSNDGILLKPLKALGVKCLGVDPSINVGKIANDAGLETMVSFFNKSAAQKILKNYGQPDILVASSIVTHLEDPHQFLEDSKILMDQGTKLIIEVEYIGSILKKTDFERFYLDRVFYYSATSLQKLFKKHGLTMTDVEKIEPHGGSIRVTAIKSGKDVKPSARLQKIIKEEQKNLTQEQLELFHNKVVKNIDAFYKKLQEYKELGTVIAGYGAPARVATICNYGRITPHLVDFIVDDSPLKQGKFTPGTHIPIVSKETLTSKKPGILVVFAHEYFEDIKKKTNGAYRYLLPLPPREVV